MKMKVFAVCAAFISLFSLSAMVQAQTLPYTCASGAEFHNATRIWLELRPGTYTASTLGIDGFNPQMAIVNAQGKELACVDDSPGAANDSVNLPTTGQVAPSATNAQAVFTVSGSDFNDIYVFVSGVGNTSGQFVFLFGTLEITKTDGQGDPVRIGVMNGLAHSRTPISIYLFSLADSPLDPLIEVSTRTYKMITLDGQALSCDDAGTLVCYGDNTALDSFEINLKGEHIPGGAFDAMLTLPWEVINRVKSVNGNLLLMMRKFEFSNEGKYVMAFHMTLGEPGG